MRVVELRVDELAAHSGVSVDTIRYYQGRGLLPAPERRGRVAHYGPDHLARLERIRNLQTQGLSLAAIGRLLSGDLDARDAPLLAAVAGAGHQRPGPLVSSLAELAEQTGIPLGLLQAAETEGLLAPIGGGYSAGDATAARAGLRLLELGLPLPELLVLARRHHEHVRSVAEEAVALFDDHIRRPLRDGEAADDSAQRVVDAFRDLLPATVALVAHHFERTLLAVAAEHIDKVGGPDELAAIAAAGRPRSAA